MLFRTDDGISSTYIFLSSLGKDFKLGCQVSGGSIVVKRGMHAQTLLDSPGALSWLVVAQVCWLKRSTFNKSSYLRILEQGHSLQKIAPITLGSVLVRGVVVT